MSILLSKRFGLFVSIGTKPITLLTSNFQANHLRVSPNSKINMKLVNLYRKNVHITYKHNLCSFPAFSIIIITISSILFPLLIVYTINHNLWQKDLLLYEQPKTNFQYKYIVVGELESGNIIVCSSFETLNQLTSEINGCDTVQYEELDYNFDGIIDQMKFIVDLEVPDEQNLKYLSMIFIIDAKVQSQCDFRIPSAIILNREMVPSNFQSGELHFNGALIANQKLSFHCSFFMSALHTHFNLKFYPHPELNQTNFEDFQISTILKSLKYNPGYFFYENSETDWNNVYETSKIRTTIQVDIEEILLRYKTTFWQKLNLIWMQYLSFLIIFVYCMNKLKELMFSTHFLRAWENVPWKKMY